MKCIAVKKDVPCDRSLFEIAEKEFSIHIKENIVEFITVNGGGYPVKDMITCDGTDYEVRVFLSASMDDPYFCLDKPMNFFLRKTNGKIIPIAVDSGDNYICVNNETGKVYFWQAEWDEYYCIANDLDEFITLFE